MNGYKEDFYSLTHEMAQACKEVRLVEIQIAQAGTPFTSPIREQPDPTRQEQPTSKAPFEVMQQSQPAKEYVLTRDELEV